MGFEAPLRGDVRQGQDKPAERVVVAEQRTGYVVRDRRRVAKAEEVKTDG
jgi:hypothetical protein